MKNIFFTGILLLMLIGVTNAQPSEVCCPVKHPQFSVENIEMISGAQTIGFNIYSDSDSVFSMLEGKVVKLQKTSGHNIVTVMCDHNISIRYFLLETKLEENSFVSKGGHLGTVSKVKFGDSYLLKIIILKSAKQFKRKDYVQFLNGCN